MVTSDSGYPLKLEFVRREARDLIQQEIVRPFNRPSATTFVTDFCNSELAKIMIEHIFWLIFCHKFPKKVRGAGGNAFSMRIKSELGTQYAMLINSAPKRIPEDVITTVVFAMTYVVHKAYWVLFPEDRNHFNLRFVTDCYHIVLEHLNGAAVTDYYIQVTVDKVFTDRFL
jgi:hypothetical protein